MLLCENYKKCLDKKSCLHTKPHNNPFGMGNKCTSLRCSNFTEKDIYCKEEIIVIMEDIIKESDNGKEENEKCTEAC